METIGQMLREARERLGLTLDEVERATRIRAHHLTALEQGQAEALPSPVHARGFLKNYAEFLGLDVDAILLRYAEAVQARRPRPRPEAAPMTRPRPAVRVTSRRPRWLSSDLFVAAAVSLTVLVVVLWGLNRVLAALGERSAAARAAQQVEAPTATPEPTPSATLELLEASPDAPGAAAAATATPTAALLPIGGSAVDLRLEAQQSTWVLVLVDGREGFRGRMIPGQTLEFMGQASVEVQTGNGAGLRAVFNGQDQGLLGGLGEVVVRLWTPLGVATPTPRPTPEPTPVTPTATATAAP